MDPLITSGITSENVARFVSAMIRETEGIETESVEQIADLLARDINKVDENRYESPLSFLLPLAISPTTGSRSSIAHYINSVVGAGHPLTISLHSLATKVLLEECEGKPKAVGVEYMVGEGLYSASGDKNRASQERGNCIWRHIQHSPNSPAQRHWSSQGARKARDTSSRRPSSSSKFLTYRLHDTALETWANHYCQGNFMQDNYETPIHIRAEEPWQQPTNTSCTRTFNASDPCFVAWQTNGTGPYSLSSGTIFLTWRSSVSWDKDADLFFLSAAGWGDSGFYPGFSQRQPMPNMWGTSLVKMQTGNPSGTVMIRSTDPRQAPDINFNFFAEGADRDLQALAEGVELLMRVYDDVGLPYEVVAPNPKVELKQALVDEAFSHHASSSCRMGLKGDGKSCVDSKFRVHGVDGLRVVDASVFPRVPGAMPNGPTFTISRKAFETILEDA
jgi:choline dehydrogenase